VKLEGGARRLPMIQAILEAEIPVMGHLGLTPQSINAIGGFKVQGKKTEDASQLLDDARQLADAGVFAIVLECVPEDLAARITEEVAVPTIGIGAGPKCDGQILVLQDMLGLTAPGGRKPRFVRRYADLAGVIRDAVTSYVDDVSAGRFPSEAESFQAEADVPPPAAFRIYG